MITPAWTPLRRHNEQRRLWRDKTRFKVVAAGRGSGKTEIARRYITRMLPVKKPWVDPLYFYALPTVAWAKRVAWKPIKRLIPQHWIKKINESELIIETVFGSELHLLGLDKPSRAEGVQWDGGIIDENSDQKPGVFDVTFLPALSHRDGWCWRIGVPKRHGIGSEDFKRAFDKAMSRVDPELRGYTWPSKDILTPEQLKFARENLDAVDFAEQYEASWETAGGAIFHAHSKHNVTATAVYHANLPIIVGSDFNVNPMCWVLMHKIGDELHVFDEIVLRNTNTQRTLDHLYGKYGQHENGWVFIGDASGRARDTSASDTDYVQICNDKRFVNKRVYYPQSNPGIVNRFAACNAMLRNAAQQTRCFINPRCVRLLADLEHRTWKEGLRIPDDTGDMGHASDAWGYVIVQLFPLRVEYDESVDNIYATAG